VRKLSARSQRARYVLVTRLAATVSWCCSVTRSCWVRLLRPKTNHARLAKKPCEVGDARRIAGARAYVVTKTRWGLLVPGRRAPFSCFINLWLASMCLRLCWWRCVLYLWIATSVIGDFSSDLSSSICVLRYRIFLCWFPEGRRRSHGGHHRAPVETNDGAIRFTKQPTKRPTSAPVGIHGRHFYLHHRRRPLQHIRPTVWRGGCWGNEHYDHIHWWQRGVCVRRCSSNLLFSKFWRRWLKNFCPKWRFTKPSGGLLTLERFSCFAIALLRTIS